MHIFNGAASFLCFGAKNSGQYFHFTNSDFATSKPSDLTKSKKANHLKKKNKLP
jgi:hypothetical protein